jgi:serine/threonine protein kinase
MHDEIEEELRTALEKAFISPEVMGPLRQEALDKGRGPLVLLYEQGVISLKTLTDLRPKELAPIDARSGKPSGDRTLTDSLPREGTAGGPAFPVPGWGRYECLGFLGEGGMGQVFLASDPHLRRKVALKFVRGDTPQLARRLLDEARAQAGIKHERICQVYEVGEVQGRPFIAMQYVEGQQLDTLVEQLSVKQKAEVLRDVAEGVHAAHEKVLHRDLKPSNILVERTADGRLKPFVMDFGVARDWKEEGVTRTGALVGTLHYMSPEQARGARSTLDARADVYSLGATLYFLLTGKVPIPGDNALELLPKIALYEPVRPRAFNRDIPLELEAIVLKCLEKDRSARYDSARALAEDLDRFIRDEPIIGRPPGLAYRLSRKARKHRVLVWVSGVALLAVVLALGWGLWSNRQASRRVRLERQLVEKVERLEAVARYYELSRPHDTRADREALRQQLKALEAWLEQAGVLAEGPVKNSLGRGYFVLGDEARAYTYLEAAWKSGFQEPRAAYIQSLILGRRYQEQLQEAERLRLPHQREARRQEVQRQYREPALAYLDYLRQTQDGEVPYSGYARALIAFHEERFDEALSQAAALEQRLPWFHEARLLRGDIFRARASRRWNRGDSAGALADFAQGREAYATAADIAASVLLPQLARGELEYDSLELGMYGSADATPSFELGLEAAARALELAPDQAAAHLLKARLNRRFAEYLQDRGDKEKAQPLLGVALEAAQAAVDLDPASSRARMELALGLWLQGRQLQEQGKDPRVPLDEAARHLDRIPEEDRSAEFHLQRGLIFETGSSYDMQVGVDPLPHLDRAIAAYDAALQKDKHLLAASFNLGTVYLRRASRPQARDPEGDMRQAQAVLDQARALNPRHTGLVWLSAQLYSLQARRRRPHGDASAEWARALEQNQQGIAINPEQPHFHNGAGLVQLELAREERFRGGDPSPHLARAQEAFERARAVAPEQGYAQHNLSEVFLHRALNQRARNESPEQSLRDALSASRQATQWLGDAAFVWSNQGMAQVILASFELEQGRDPRQTLARGAEALGKALGKNPQDSQALLYRGEHRAVLARWQARQGQGRSEDFEQAARDFREAITLAPDTLEYRLAFGHFCREWARWLKRQGQAAGVPLQQGMDEARRLLAMRPEWPEARALRDSLLGVESGTSSPTR